MPVQQQAIYRLMDVLEAGAPDEQTGHLLVHSLTYWLRYLDYLRIIQSRFEPVSAAWIAAQETYMRMPIGPVPRSLTPAEMAQVREKETFGALAQLEIESFYVFAKILLDRVADTLCLYLGVNRPTNGSSHSELVKKNHLASTCGRLRISPDKLWPLLTGLHTRIVDFRTEVIEHLKEPRQTRDILPGPDRKVHINTGSRIYSRAGDPEQRLEQTEDPAILLRDVEAYVDVVVEFMVSNIDRSGLARKGTDQRAAAEGAP
jgi:hypothetical protein